MRPPRDTPQASLEAVRDPLANPGAVRAALARPMSERLELALSWNAVASELRAGLSAVKASQSRGQDLADVRLLESLADEDV